MINNTNVRKQAQQLKKQMKSGEGAYKPKTFEKLNAEVEAMVQETINSVPKFQRREVQPIKYTPAVQNANTAQNNQNGGISFSDALGVIKTEIDKGNSIEARDKRVRQQYKARTTKQPIDLYTSLYDGKTVSLSFNDKAKIIAEAKKKMSGEESDYKPKTDDEKAFMAYLTGEQPKDEFYENIKKLDRVRQLPGISRIDANKQEREKEKNKNFLDYVPLPTTAINTLRENDPKRLQEITDKQKKDFEQRTQEWQDKYLKADYYTSSLPKSKDFSEKSKTVKSFADNDAVYAAVSGDVEKAANLGGLRIPSMTETEKNVYKYLYATKGKKEADAYLYILNDKLTSRSNKESLNDVKKFSVKHPVVSSAGTVLSAPVRGFSGLGAIIDDAVRNGSGRPINTNSDWHQWGNVTQTARQVIDKEYASKAFGGATLPVIGNVGSFLYNTCMSMGDNVVNMLLAQGIVGAAYSGGVNVGAIAAGEKSLKTANNIISAIVTGLMSGDAAAQGVVEAKKKGLTDSQAVAEGWAQGITEGLTEKFSIDKILEKTSVAALLQSVVSEGSEEMVSEIANAFTDYLIAGDQSDWSNSIKEYLNKGYSEHDAIKNTLIDLGWQAAAAGIGGAFSGLGLGIGKNISDYAIKTTNKNFAIKHINSEIQNQMKNIMQAEEKMKNDPKNKSVYKDFINATKDYIGDLKQYSANIKGKTDTETANYKNTKQFSSVTEFNPNYWDIAGNQFARVEQKTSNNGNINYKVTFFDGTYVVKNTKQFESRFHSVQNDENLQNHLNNIIANENVNNTDIKYFHVYDENKVSKDFINSVNIDIENAVNEIRNNNTDKVPDTIHVTQLNDTAIKNISDFSGIDVSDYQCKIERDSLIHIEKRHGLNGTHDQSLSDPKDIARIGYVLNNSDSIEWAKDDSGNLVYSKKYNNKDNKPCPVMLVSAKVDGTYVVSQVIPDTKRKTLWVTSARMQKANVGSQVPNTDNSQQHTSETPLNSSSASGEIGANSDMSAYMNTSAFHVNEEAPTNNSIPQNGNNVNNNSAQNEKNNSNTSTDGKRHFNADYAKSTVREFGQILGVNVEFSDNLGRGVDGMYITRNGKPTIIIANETSDPIMTVFKHELTHSFQVTDPEAYAEYKKYVIDKLQAYNPEIYKEHFNSLWEKYCKQYNADTRNGRIIKTVKNENGTVNYVTDENGMFVYDGEKRVTAADIEDEIAARATESFLTDEKGIAFQKMADKNPNAAKGFINALRSMILRLVQFSQQLKERFAGAFNTKAETEMLRADINTFREAERMFTDMLEGRYNANAKNVQDVNTDRSATENAETERPKQLFKDFNAVTDSIINVSDKAAKEYADNRIAVEISAHTPDVILNNVEGSKDLRVIMNYSKLYLAVRKDGVFKGHYHNLGAETAKKLPSILSNPDAIVQLDNGRLNIFTTIKTEKGDNGVISVELNSTKDIDGKYEDYNVVVTMFSSDDNYVKNLLSGKNISVKYTKEDLSQVNPQLYKWLAIINDKSSADNSISQNDTFVNSSIRNNSGNDTAVSFNAEKIDGIMNDILDYSAKFSGVNNEKMQKIVNAVITLSNADLYSGGDISADIKQNITDSINVLRDSLNNKNLTLKVADGIRYIADTAENAVNAKPRLSISDSFANDFKDWIKRGKPDREILTVGKTSDALKSIGVKNQTITWDTSKINKSLKKHLNIDENVIEQIPNVLEYPILVMQSKQFDSRIVLLGEVYDKNKLPVMAILELQPLKDKSGVVLDEIKVASTYSKVKKNDVTNITPTQNFINSSDILYIEPNKKRTDNWLMRTRLQLPFGITNYGSIRSITYPQGNVNTNSMQKSDNYSVQSDDKPKFSLAEPVEETKYLIAVHNLNQEKLEGNLELGGIPMPSIAVTKADVGHTDFGDITLLFRKDTIDPELSQYNKLYGGDAYTPMFPTIDYEADRGIVNKIKDKYLELSSKYSDSAARALYKYSDPVNAEDTLNRTKGEKSLISNAKDDIGLMQTFLYDAGVGEIATVEKKTTTQINEATVKQYDYFIEKLGKSAFEDLARRDPGTSVFAAKKAWIDKYMPKFDEAMTDYYSETFGFTKDETRNILNAQTNASKVDMAREILKYIHNGKETVKTEPDYAATNEKIRKTAKEHGYDEWVEKLFSGIEKGKGIYNGKDPYTPSGNKKSFAQLHDEFTIDNVVSNMRKQLGKGQSSLFSGANNVQGAATKGYKSISEMKQDSKRLLKLSDEEINTVKSGFSDRLSDIIERACKYPEQYGNALNDFSSIVIEGLNKTKSPAAFRMYLTKEGNGIYNITKDICDDILSLVNDMREVPVKYFEAKPYRAIDFNEVEAVIVPNNTDESFINKLENKGLNVVKYGEGENDRVNTVNEVADRLDVKFSLADDTYENVSITQTDIEALRNIPRKSVNEFTSDEIKTTEKFAKRYYKELGVKSPFFRAWFGDWRANDTTPIKPVPIETLDIQDVIMQSGEYRINDTDWNVHAGATLRDETKHYSRGEKVSVKALSAIKDILNNAVLLDTEVSEASSSKKSVNTAFMHKLYTPIRYNGNTYIAKISVEEYLSPSDTIERKAYHLQNIKIEAADGSATDNNISASRPRSDTASINSISDLFKFVKTFDKNFKPKPASKVVNEDGTPKVMYHGSPNDFSVFDLKKARYSGTFGKGFYFTDSNSHASTYGNLYEVYLDVKNPVEGGIPVNKKQLEKFIAAVADNEDYSIENYGTYETSEVFNQVNKTNLFTALRDINSTAIGDFVEAVKLYNSINGTNYDGIISETETVVFSPNQIKSATDNIGTFDKNNLDIRYSLADDTDVFKPNEAEAQRYAAQVDNWLNGKMKSSDMFELGRTPVVLRELGARDLPIVMSQDVMVKVTGGKHSISLDELKQLPQAIADPIMTFKSATVNNAYVILTELTDKHGNDVVVAMHLGRKRGFNIVNNIASVYGKENIGIFVKEQINLGNLKYIDKNKSHDWLRSRGLQLPKLNTNHDFNNSILQKEDIVNRYSAQNINKNTDKINNADPDKHIIDKIISGKEPKLSLKEEKAYKRLEDTNKLLREHFKLTPGEKVTEEHALKLAKKYVKQYGLVYDTADYASKIKEVINHEAENAKNNNSEYNIFEELQAVNAEMLENASVLDTTLSDKYKDLAARLKKGVQVTDEMRNNITDYKDFKASVRNSLPLKKESGADVDKLYQELTEEYPEFFSNDIINPVDRLFRLAEVSQAIKPQIVTPEYGTSSINDIANIVTAEMLEELTPQTKMGKRVNELKYKLGETKRAMRAQAAYSKYVAVQKANARGAAKLEKAKQAMEAQKTHLKREGDLRVAFAVDKEAAKLEKYKTERKNQAARDYLFKALDKLLKMGAQSINNEKFDSARKAISDEIVKINENIEKDTEKLKGELSEKERSDTERHLTWLKNTLEKKVSALKNLGGMKADGVDFERQKAELMKKIAAVAQANIDSSVDEINNLIMEQNKKIAEFKEKLGGDLPQDKVKQIGGRIKALEARRDRLLKQADKKQSQGGDNLNIYKALKDSDIDVIEDFIKETLNLQNDIRTYGKALKNAKTSDLYLIADKIAREQEEYAKLRNGKKGHKQRTFGDRLKIQAMLSVLSPMRVARMVTGYNKNSELMRIFNDIDKGQEDVRKFKYQANKMFEDAFKNADISLIDTINKLSGKKADTVKIKADGKEYEITKGMRVSLYLHSLNESNMFHIEHGGIIIPGIREFKKGKAKEAFEKGTRSVPIKLTADEIAEIISGMSKEEKLYAEVAHKFFNEKAKNAINARSEYLVGYDIADVVDYFPIVTERTVSDIMLDNNPLLSSMYMNSGGEYKEDRSGIASIEGRGEYKSRMKGSSNPIMLEDAYSVVKRHIRNTAQYYGMSMPLRNLTEVLNTFTFSDGRFETVSSVLEENWGANFTEWLVNLRKDLNFGRKINSDTITGKVINRVSGTFAGAVLTGNLSVILKQTSSYPTAIAELGPEAIARGFADMSKITDDFINSLTGIYAARGNGVSDVSFEDVLNENPLVQKSPSIVRAFSKGIETADKITVKKLFKAAMWSVKLSDSKYKNMDMKTAMKSDDFKAKVVDAYIRTVENTQPMYDTMQRNVIQRTPDKAVRFLFPFMTQRFQNLGIMIDAIGNYKAKRLEFRANKNDTTEADLKEARKRFVWAVQSRLIASIMITGINALWKLLRDKTSEWKDDDDETDKSKVLAWSIEDFLKNNIGDIPYGNTLYSSIMNAGKLIANAFLDKYDSEFKFDVENPFNSSVDKLELQGIEVLNDLISLPAYILVNREKKTIPDIVLNSATYAARFVGFPADSIRNIYLVTLNTIRQGMKKMGKDTTEYDFRVKSLEWKVNEKNASKFYEYSNRAFLNYLKSGKKSDLKIYNDISDELIKGGISQDKIESKAYKYAFDKNEVLSNVINDDKYFNRLLKQVEVSVLPKYADTDTENKATSGLVKKFTELQYKDFEKSFNSELKNIAKDKGTFDASSGKWENSGRSMIEAYVAAELKTRLKQYYGYVDKEGNKNGEVIQADFDKYVKLKKSGEYKEANSIEKHLNACGYATELKKYLRKNK